MASTEHKILSTGSIEYYLEVFKLDSPLASQSNDRVHDCGIVTREEDRYLLYRTPSIMVKAHVKIQKSIANHDWLIGFVQATDRMESENVFGSSGKARWELHPLKSGKQKMVNSSSGNSSTPYIMGNNVLRIRRGEMRKCTTCIQFEEYHEPTINWWILSRSNRLTKVVRRNRIVLWLVAFRTRKSLVELEAGEIDWRSEKISVLATVKWDLQVAIDIDPDQSLGNRVRGCRRCLIGPKVCEGERRRLPASALSSLSAADCQSLIWYPRRGQVQLDDRKSKVQILVPPRKIIADSWEQWVTEMTGSVSKVDMSVRPDYLYVDHCIDDPFISTYRSRARRCLVPLVKEEPQKQQQQQQQQKQQLRQPQRQSTVSANVEASMGDEPPRQRSQ
ncbi:hypothetical protein BOX15_Mlig027459g2 [Macrostomum lignano]|uniref:Uncharacterized protein n=1 Tax=Macrostomum lignano TaxID=282301 RepID=A0A267DJV5_9PLAT|nr:hypothetical protein BOX15_Mlig027459g3 [Macrostomum lignano]PAA69800.1 hypothetical protein BOX15_Mlig027459g2 [Macrostomum lignano]